MHVYTIPDSDEVAWFGWTTVLVGKRDAVVCLVSDKSTVTVSTWAQATESLLAYQTKRTWTKVLTLTEDTCISTILARKYVWRLTVIQAGFSSCAIHIIIKVYYMSFSKHTSACCSGTCCRKWMNSLIVGLSYRDWGFRIDTLCQPTIQQPKFPAHNFSITIIPVSVTNFSSESSCWSTELHLSHDYPITGLIIKQSYFTLCTSWICNNKMYNMRLRQTLHATNIPTQSTAPSWEWLHPVPSLRIVHAESLASAPVHVTLKMVPFPSPWNPLVKWNPTVKKSKELLRKSCLTLDI